VIYRRVGMFYVSENDVKYGKIAPVLIKLKFVPMSVKFKLGKYEYIGTSPFFDSYYLPFGSSWGEPKVYTINWCYNNDKKFCISVI
jgi:hypothetical protein